ncbi:hypothetical protein J2128_001719 [Methanomicrobium sp. W14]|nr:hypothetical protein [Methanomicrobium sp. W14]
MFFRHRSNTVHLTCAGKGLGSFPDILRHRQTSLAVLFGDTVALSGYISVFLAPGNTNMNFSIIIYMLFEII